jgi:hypothetical protein
MEQNLHEKLIVTQLIKKFPVFFGTQRFRNMLTRAHYKTIS